MRKLLLFIAILLASSGIANADDYERGTQFEYQGLKFYITDSSHVALNGYATEQPKGKLTIPSKAIYKEKEFKVEWIWEGALNDCDKLTSIYIPTSIAGIDFKCFKGCTELSEIIFDEAHPKYKAKDAIVYSTDNKILYFCSNWHKGEFSVPNDVTSIESYAFYGCKYLTKLICHDGVTSIRYNAFWECSALEEVILPVRMKTLKSFSLSGMPALKKIQFPKDLEEIGTYAFWNCTSLEEIELPRSLKKIDERAFRNCIKLKRITLPENLEELASYAFGECKELEEIILPENITIINNATFANCESLKKIVVSSKLTTIDACAFLGCSKLESIDIPKSVTTIGERAFDACYSMKSINVHWDSPLEIKNWVFSYVDTKNIKLYVPLSKQSSYKASNFWRNFEIIER